MTPTEPDREERPRIIRISPTSKDLPPIRISPASRHLPVVRISPPRPAERKD